jgi:uncharacterized membrane protein (DUF2068 family)
VFQTANLGAGATLPEVILTGAIMQRPTGLSIIAGYAVVVGLLPLAVSVKFLLDASTPAWAAVVQLLPALWVLAAAWGLWQLRPWGLWMSVAYFCFVVFWTGPEFLDVVSGWGSPLTFYSFLVIGQTSISLVILAYLLRPVVRRRFGKRKDG